MEPEFEAKFYPVDKDRFRLLLKSLGAELVFPERKFRRLLFGHEDNPQIQANYLRVRDEGNLISLSLKVQPVSNGPLSAQKEAEIEVSSFETAIEIMESVGLKKSSYHENLREEWRLDRAQITIDSWPGLLSWTEIETFSPAEVKRVALKLGFDWRKKIVAPASFLYSRIYCLSEEEALAKLKNLTFENFKKVFAGLKPVDRLVGFDQREKGIK